MADENDARVRTLRLFIQKADKLYNMTFTQSLLTGDTRISFGGEATDEGFVFRREGPHDESIEAFLLTFRMITQDNDQISLRNIRKILCQLPLSQQRLTAAENSGRNLNDHLDSPVGINIFGERPTRRQVLEAFLYGDLGHTNKENRARFERWTENPVAGDFMKTQFTAILVDVLNVISWFRNACFWAIEIVEGRHQDA